MARQNILKHFADVEKIFTFAMNFCSKSTTNTENTLNTLFFMENMPAVAQAQQIESWIYEIRGRRVMLDFDLAAIYGIETKYLKRSVKNNIERFLGDDFMFEITRDELSRCKICTLNKNGRGNNIKYLPFAFTELGIAMLSSVLNSRAAIEANRNIMRTFVYMRQVVLNASPTKKIEELEQQMHALKKYIEEAFSDYNDINEDTRVQLELINQSLAELQMHKQIAEKPRQPIGFIQPSLLKP